MTKTTATASDSVQAAEERLAALRAERRELPNAIREANQRGDFDTLQRLIERSDRLPTEIRAAELALIQARIAEIERRKNEVAAQLPGLKEREQAAYDALQAAKRVHLEAQQSYTRANNQIHALTSQMGQLRGELDQLLSQQAATGPVVRSAWQAR